MNFKNLFKTLVLSLLVVAFAACDTKPQGDPMYDFVVKYDGQTVKENDVIVVTMDNFDVASKEMVANFEVTSTGNVANKIDIFETRKFTPSKFVVSLAVGANVMEYNSEKEQIWALGEVPSESSCEFSFRFKPVNEGVRTVCESEYVVSNGYDSKDLTFKVRYIYKSSKQLADSEKDVVKLLGNCKSSDMESATLMGIADGLTHTIGGATLLSAENLLKTGSHIVGVRVFVGKPVESGSVFLGKDFENPEMEKEFSYKQGGWQYILFDEPYDFKQDTYIGFKATGNTDFMAIETSVKAPATEMIFIDGSWLFVTNEIGRGVWSMQAIVAGGDYSNERQKDVILERASVSDNPKVGEPMVVSCELRNAGVMPAENVVVKCVLGAETKTVNISEKVMNGQSIVVNFEDFVAPTIDGVFSNVDVEFVAEYEGDAATTNNDADASVCVYSAETTERIAILAEQFTGQDCGFCPGGAETLKKSIAGMKNPEKVIWVAHHYGYTNDAFTLNESVIIGQLLGVSGAPSCAIDRMAVSFAPGQSALCWHPAYSTTELLEGLIKTPALATIELERTFNVADSTLTVVVRGKSLVDVTNLTVLVKQSGIIARQANAGNKYVHNNAPRKFLTAAKGDVMTLDNGNYEATYTYKVPAKVGSFNCVLEDMDVVAFVHGDLTKSSRLVYNAIQVPLLETQTQNVMRAMPMHNNYGTEIRAISEQICY